MHRQPGDKWLLATYGALLAYALVGGIGGVLSRAHDVLWNRMPDIRLFYDIGYGVVLPLSGLIGLLGLRRPRPWALFFARIFSAVATFVLGFAPLLAQLYSAYLRTSTLRAETLGPLSVLVLGSTVTWRAFWWTPPDKARDAYWETRGGKRLTELRIVRIFRRLTGAPA